MAKALKVRTIHSPGDVLNAILDYRGANFERSTGIDIVIESCYALLNTQRPLSTRELGIQLSHNHAVLRSALPGLERLGLAILAVKRYEGRGAADMWLPTPSAEDFAREHSNLRLGIIADELPSRQTAAEIEDAALSCLAHARRFDLTDTTADAQVMADELQWHPETVRHRAITCFAAGYVGLSTALIQERDSLLAMQQART